MKTYRYVIIGGGIAGGRACDGIRKLDAEGSIALVTSEAHRPYQRPPLSKGYLTGKQGLDQVYLKEADAYARERVELISGVPATAVDAAARRVTLADGQTLGYEALLLATGSSVQRLPIPGADLAGVLTLRTIEDFGRHPARGAAGHGRGRARRQLHRVGGGRVAGPARRACDDGVPGGAPAYPGGSARAELVPV